MEPHLNTFKNAQKHARRSVSGQRNLIEMTLTRGGNTEIYGHLDGRESRRTVSTMHRPLLPIGSAPPGIPRLRPRYRSPSSNASGLQNRKRKISWICFALCMLFPYLLILYGHSGLDAVMAFITNGDIQHFGRQQKKYAKIVGWSAAGATALTLIVAFIIIRTLPNTYPR